MKMKEIVQKIKSLQEHLIYLDGGPHDLHEEKKLTKKLIAQYQEKLNKKTFKKVNVIRLTVDEINSRRNRQHAAEGLILQLPFGHGGRNSWLLNYGTGEIAKEFRRARDIKFSHKYQAAKLKKYENKNT